MKYLDDEHYFVIWRLAQREIDPHFERKYPLRFVFPDIR